MSLDRVKDAVNHQHRHRLLQRGRKRRGAIHSRPRRHGRAGPLSLRAHLHRQLFPGRHRGNPEAHCERGHQRQNHRQCPQLRPYPLAHARFFEGQGDIDRSASSPISGSPALNSADDRQVGRRLLHGALHQEVERGEPTHILDPQKFYQVVQRRSSIANLRELHRLRPVRPRSGGGGAASFSDPYLISRHDRGDRPAALRPPLRSASPWTRVARTTFTRYTISRCWASRTCRRVPLRLVSRPGILLLPPVAGDRPRCVFAYKLPVSGATSADPGRPRPHVAHLARRRVLRPGWHIPGAIIRYKQAVADCIRACARQELGAEVLFEPAPIQVIETIRLDRSRGHFDSRLDRCRLLTPPEETLRAEDSHPPAAGAWRWHQESPPDLLEVHAPYVQYFRC